MEMRVEQLSVHADVSVDTIRYYQSKGLLDPPRRQGRVAWYDDTHLQRLARVRTLQQRGFTLATIARLVSGDLDAADEALVSELSGLHSGSDHADAVPVRQPDDDAVHRTTSASDQAPNSTGPNPEPGPAVSAGHGPAPDDQTFTLAELAGETGVPLALLKAIEAEGLLVPRRIGVHDRYTREDVAASKAGLLLLEWGIPLSALLELARRHHEATVTVAEEAVTMFSTYVRGPLRQGGQTVPGASQRPGTPADGGNARDVDRLLRAYSELLPAVNTLVGHHFTRTLMRVALDHVEQIGSVEGRRAIWDRVEVDGSDAGLGPTADIPAAIQ
jgi:DNA-binding transcriptional MerR regulator